MPRRSNFKKWIYSGIVAAVAALLLGNKGIRTVVKNTFLLRRLHREMEVETREEERLQRSIAAVETDDRALEKAARKELGYVKPGEVEYRFPPPAARRDRALTRGSAASTRRRKAGE